MMVERYLATLPARNMRRWRTLTGSPRQTRVSIIEAMGTAGALPIRVGPVMFGNSMPDYLHTEKDLWILELEDLHERARYRTRQRRDERHRAAHRHALCTPSRISRMEKAFDWIIWVWDAEVRECIMAFAMVQTRGWERSRFVARRNKRNRQKKSWLRQNSYRWIAQSSQIMSSNCKQRLFV
jgi:hypothetical protein